MAYNPALTVNEANLDDICNIPRVRATNEARTVGGTTVAANPLGTAWIEGAGTPYSATSGSNMPVTTAQLLTGIMVLKPSANVQLNFDTAAQIVAGVNAVTSGCQVGDYLTFTVINGAAANTLAPTVSTGITFDANQANTTIAANTSRYFMFRFTNVTPGSEAIVAYW